MTNFTTEHEDKMETMNLGLMQAKEIKHARVKQKLVEEYLKRTKKHIKDKVEWKKYDKSYLCDISTNF